MCLVWQNVRLKPDDAFAILSVDFKFERIERISCFFVSCERVPWLNLCLIDRY